MQEGIPDICGDLMNKMLDMGVLNKLPDQLTVNQYQPGQGMIIVVCVLFLRRKHYLEF